MIDLDPQGNATSGAGIPKKSLKLTINDVLTAEVPMEDVIIETEFDNLDLIPTNIALAGAEFELFQHENSEYTLKGALAPIQDKYNYIIIDCPPSLGMLTVNAMAASDGVVIPMQCEYYALEGLSQLMLTIRKIKQLYNPELSLGGVILTMYDGRLNLSLAVAAEIRKHFPGQIFRSTVPRNVRLSEAPSHGKPAYYYDKHSKGAQAYLEIAREMEKRG